MAAVMEVDTSPQPVSSLPEWQQILKKITMTDTQKSKLNQALSEFIHEGCMQDALYNTLVDNRVYLDFGMMPSSNPASYRTEIKGITFANTESITSASLKEELFHAWQDAYYPGGTFQYGKDTQGNKSPGYANIEFEAKIFKDIIMPLYCCMAFNIGSAPDNIIDDYNIWMRSIQDNPLSLSDSDYQKWLNLFNQYTHVYSSSLSPTLSSPQALRKIISSSDCF